MALAKTYLKKGTTKTLELLSDFGIYTGNVPFKRDIKVKALSKNSWHDEHGDEEYVPANMMLEGYEMTFEIGYKGSYKTADTAVEALVTWLRGAGTFKLYCDYNGIGNSSVRFVSLSRPTLDISDDGDGDIKKWNLTLKVNDPTASWSGS